MASSSTISILNTLEWIKRFTFLRPSAMGSFLEPALTSANTIVQTILGPPFFWRWNRVVTGFVTKVGQQDYTIFNWKPTFAINLQYVLVDSNGYCQACTTAGTTGSTIPSFNATPTGTTGDGSAVWTNMGSINTPVSTTYNFAWIETVSIQVINPQTAAVRWKQFSPKITLALDESQARPGFIAAQLDNGQGDITFRLMPVPDQVYPVSITVQQQPPVFTGASGGINQTWAPIPDEYSMIYSWGMLALMLLYADDPRFQMANQKFVASLLSTHGGLNQTEQNIFLNNWQALTGQPVILQSGNQQSFQGRLSI